MNVGKSVTRVASALEFIKFLFCNNVSSMCLLDIYISFSFFLFAQHYDLPLGWFLQFVFTPIFLKFILSTRFYDFLRDFKVHK